MKYTLLGHSGLNVSRICLGCMSFGDPAQGMHSWTLDQTRTTEIIAHALDKGVNFFDTAMGYQNGTSEIYTGHALRSLAPRDRYVLATKFFPRPSAEISARTHIENCLNASLKRLGADYVDLYILHMWDYSTPIEETLEALHRAVTAGKVRAIGVSNCFAWQLARANAAAEQHGWTRFTSVQGHHNLIFREEEREMLPCCKAENVALTPYSALAAGRLCRLPGETTQRLEKDAFAKGKYDHAEAQDAIIIRRVHEIAESRGVSMTQIALAWLLTKVDSPVTGATRPEQIDDAAAATEITLTPEETTFLEEPYQPHRLVGVMAQNR